MSEKVADTGKNCVMKGIDIALKTCHRTSSPPVKGQKKEGNALCEYSSSICDEEELKWFPVISNKSSRLQYTITSTFKMTNCYYISVLCCNQRQK